MIVILMSRSISTRLVMALGVLSLARDASRERPTCPSHGGKWETDDTTKRPGEEASHVSWTQTHVV
jgi:hypothetical protein